MGKIVNWLLLISFMVLMVSFWNRNEFSESLHAIPQLNLEPKQTAISEPAFGVNYGGVNYSVEPQYYYELYGLVVSYRHHNGDSMLHKVWNDHLNTADVCVIWGRTAFSAYLNKIRFWNGQFTCNVKTKSSVAWNSFNMHELSNNHLITDDEWIRDKIKAINIGDQIRVSGFLSSYGALGGAKRGTSITRTDTGNGACETIFVNDFAIVKKADNPWRIAMYASLVVFILSLFVYFYSPYRVQ